LCAQPSLAQQAARKRRRSQLGWIQFRFFDASNKCM
jgi:hypothetical protein